MALTLYPPDEFEIGIKPPYDVREVTDHPFNIIKSLANDSLSVESAINLLADPIDKLTTTGFEDEAMEGVHFLTQTFNALLPQIPHDHPAAAGLATITASLMTRPTPLTPSALPKQCEEYKAQGVDIDLETVNPWSGMSKPRCRYSDVPASDYVIQRDIMCHGKDDYRPQYELPNRLLGGSKEAENAIKNEWTRHNAFLARLLTHPKFPHRDIYLARSFYAIVPALESVYHAHSDESLSADVPAAAAWLIYAGDVIFAAAQWEIPSQNLGRLGRVGGPLWEQVEGRGTVGEDANGGKEEGFSRQRWDFWKVRLRWIEEESQADEEAKRMAREAMGKMEEVEKARTS